MTMVGKRLGKLLIVDDTIFPEGDPRRRKYKRAYLVRCDCGVEKLMPQTGIADCRSCGCSKYDHLKVNIPWAIRYCPEKTEIGNLKTNEIYEDL